MYTIICYAAVLVDCHTPLYTVLLGSCFGRFEVEASPCKSRSIRSLCLDDWGPGLRQCPFPFSVKAKHAVCQAKYFYKNMQTDRSKFYFVWSTGVFGEIIKIQWQKNLHILKTNFYSLSRKFCDVHENPTVANISRHELDIAYRPILMRNAQSRTLLTMN
jgi:hypothetical protein